MKNGLALLVSPFLYIQNKSKLLQVDYSVIFTNFVALKMKCMKKMELNSYRFTSDEDPTDEQLKQIMKEVAIDVRKRAEKANQKFQEELRQLCDLKVNKPLVK